jgi:hypothetical protein
VATATLCFVIPADVPAARRDELVRCLLREVETLR